ncbi:LysR family transcriptional regulator [Microbacterium sp. Root61]|uniref:LysR substrate-binding domain-containing protein n=1 Tax=Microbacterium sp. Root61 TaxID=1736570 RepID=UPI0006FA1B43|nr:LysR substrate-binding domain-containing protein [Microbacterium sp. Root61]KRA24771.1 LysR family transcriptional regulator [Microbacterium sp. Root61]
MFDPVLLRTFVALAETRSFTRAAAQLQISQPTVSQQIRRLEAAARRALVARDSRTVELTDNGEAMLGFAREILAAHDAAAAYFDTSAMRGRVRFGSADDLALTELPQILREFRRVHPQIDLSLTVGQSAALVKRLQAGQFDLVYVKQEPGLPTGHLVRRDRHIWVSHEDTRVDLDAPVPLIAYPAPSHSRAAAIQTLESVGRNWRITCNVRDVNGALAAVRAGIGIAVLPQAMVPADLVPASPTLGLPQLGEIDFTLLTNPRSAGGPVEALVAAIIRRAAK